MEQFHKCTRLKYEDLIKTQIDEEATQFCGLSAKFEDSVAYEGRSLGKESLARDNLAYFVYQRIQDDPYFF